MPCVSAAEAVKIDNTNLIVQLNAHVGTHYRYSNRFAHRLCAMNTDEYGVETIELTCELDSHADTCAVGRDFVMLSKAHRCISVHPFAEEYNPLTNAPIATVATVWTDSENQSYLLVIHQALFLGDRMGSSLLCPNQMRAHGIVVNDVPKQFDPHSTHSIHVPDADLTIPLTMAGVISGFATCKPTSDELEHLPQVVLTADSPWQPRSAAFADAEEKLGVAAATVVRNGDPNSIAASSIPRLIKAVRTYQHTFAKPSPDLDAYAHGDDLYERLIATVTVHDQDC